MIPVSVVILAKNEAHQIARCIAPWVGITDDILVVDNGSTDDTLAIASAAGARNISTPWKGYGATKNEGHQHTEYDWILSLDADEVANPNLVQSVQDAFVIPPYQHNLFSIQRKLVYGNKVLHFGAVSKERRIRLFHKQFASWNQHLVHEDLIFGPNPHHIALKGFVWHYSYPDVKNHPVKMKHYAQLSAQQMFQSGKKWKWWKRYGSPIFGFIKNFIFRLGFLDGPAGFHFAKTEALYTFQKYSILKTLLLSKK